MSTHRHTAASVTRTARTRSVRIITRFFGNLSANAARNGDVIAPSVKRMAIQMPTDRAPPSPYAHTATAVA